jgi:hypothetical protein
LLRELLETRDVLARQLVSLRDRESFHAIAALDRIAEDRVVARARPLADLDELERETQVGLVDAVALHRVAPRHARERRLDLDVHRLAERLGEHALPHLEHVVFLDERHLHVELRELRLAIGAQVLVAEAARDLEVAVESRDHQDLLEQLRRLRQRVELARMHA